MTAITLAEAKNNAVEDYDPAVIDEFRKESAVMDALVFDQAVNHLDIALASEAPDAATEAAARELRSFCRDKSKGIYYRTTASPLRWRLSNFLPNRRGPAAGTEAATPGSVR